MTNDILQKIKIPAIGLLVGAILNGLVGFVVLLSGLLRLTGKFGSERLPTDEAGRIGYYIGTFFGYGVALLGLLLAPVIFYGALKMMKGEKYSAARTAAILAIVPLACCFPLSAVFGVWALVVLAKPETKAFFQGGMNQPFYPPQPPQSW